MPNVDAYRNGFIVLGALTVVGWVGCEPGPDQSLGLTSLASSRSDLDLGSVRHGRKALGTLQVANTSSQTRRIDRVESSCPCLSIAPESFDVSAKSSTPVGITFDPATEPDFRGRLSIEVKGREANGDVVFTFRVAVTVED